MTLTLFPPTVYWYMVQTRGEEQLLLIAEQAGISLIRYVIGSGWESAGPLISPISQARGGGYWNSRGWLQKPDDQVHQYQPKTPQVQPTCVGYIMCLRTFSAFTSLFIIDSPELVIWEVPDHRLLNYL